MQVKCLECGREGEVYSKKGIETIIWGYEEVKFILKPNEIRHWIVWDRWKKAYCENCLKKDFGIKRILKETRSERKK